MEKKSIYMICISIIIGFAIVGVSIYYGLVNSQKEKESYFRNYNNNNLRYEMITHGNNVLIFDKFTGDYWQKFLSQNEGPTEWKAFKSPLD